MVKRIISILLVVLNILCFANVSYAEDVGVLECSNITFVDSDGNPVTALSGEQLTAKVECTNNSNKKLNPALLVCSYQNGRLNNAWYESIPLLEGLSDIIYVNFTPSTTDENTVIKATVLEGLKVLRSPYSSATMLANTTSVMDIMVNGKVLDGLSDDVDNYLVRVDKDELNISVDPEDGGTKVEIEKPENVPGVGNIKLTSPNNTQRNIAMTFYKQEEDLYSLTKLSYKLTNGDRTEIPLENSTINTDGEMEYEITLPDNTFYVTVEPEILSVSQMEVRIKDIDHTNTLYGGVSYVIPGASFSKYLTPRYSLDNVIPIKNEETHAKIAVSYGDNKKTYVVKFKSKQPRLTEFNVTGGAGDKYKPVFISGAAVNNDNGTSASPDRVFSMGNISESFIGGSMFMMYMASNRNADNGNTWFHTNTSGEYFNFKADTPGTIYFVSRTSVKNSEFEDNGWENVSNTTGVELPDGYDNWNTAPAIYNSFDEGAYYFNVFEWGTSANRYEKTGLLDAATKRNYAPFVYTWKKSFVAGESVSVYHSGQNTSNAAGMEAIIIWDIQ